MAAITVAKVTSAEGRREVDPPHCGLLAAVILDTILEMGLPVGPREAAEPSGERSLGVPERLAIMIGSVQFPRRSFPNMG